MLWKIIAMVLASLLIFFWKYRRNQKKSAYYFFGHHGADLSEFHEKKLRRLGRNKELYSYRTGNIRKLIRSVHRFMEDIGCPYWVESGILLGIHHYNDVLPYDCDLDIGIVDREKLSSMFVDKKENLIILKDYGISLEKTSHHAIQFVFRDLETDVYCDVFCYNLEGDKIVQEKYYSKNPFGDWPCKECSGTVFSMDSSIVFPLKKFEGEHFHIYIPNDSEKCLKYIYSDITPYYVWSEEENDYVKKD